ncbi:MAG: pyridoxamine 5'-phosphate oxidase family protein [Deltaproteobacteria bacterium]|nr:pyridoxamine 5'-phosphate oxidase family protein [Deltaproteobacteria bacterium]MBW2308893.1 pyridoxamine 5'-phosphate oxidase family protein [Deltaproteobacteria bacterium]
MSKITKQLKERIERAGTFFVATSNKAGIVHLAAAEGLRVQDDENVAFADWFCFKTLEHLTENPRVAIGFMDKENRKGFQLLGKVEAVHTGAILDGFAAECGHEEDMAQYPQEQHELLVRVEQILELSTGPHSDKDIEE